MDLRLYSRICWILTITDMTLGDLLNVLLVSLMKMGTLCSSYILFSPSLRPLSTWMVGWCTVSVISFIPLFFLKFLFCLHTPNGCILPEVQKRLVFGRLKFTHACLSLRLYSRTIWRAPKLKQLSLLMIVLSLKHLSKFCCPYMLLGCFDE